MNIYDRPTPETDAFMLQIDDSEIDIGQVEAKLKTLECERDYALELFGPKLAKFESEYRACYALQLASCDHWIRLSKQQNPEDSNGLNFHQGRRRALVFNNIKMERLLRMLKRDACPQCGDDVIQTNLGGGNTDDFCENCGWPDEDRTK